MLQTPLRPTVEIQPIGRGPTMRLEGVVLQAMLVVDRLVEHWVSPCSCAGSQPVHRRDDLGELRAGRGRAAASLAVPM